MKKIKIGLISVLSMVIFVVNFTSCEKAEMVEDTSNNSTKKTEINTIDNLTASIGNRMISITEDVEEENGMRGTLYLFETNLGEQEIFVPNKIQEKTWIDWIYSTGTMYAGHYDGTITCDKENRNCYVLFGRIHANF